MPDSQETFSHVTSQPSFVTKTPPSIDDNTVIIAVASPDLKTGVQSRNGWFLSDFYAFNYLFKGLGHSQTWLTAADPERLLETYGNYLHGNPYQEQKVVLSSSLLQNGEITPPVVVEPEGMIDRFLNEIERASAEAVQHDRPLLIMVFCHGLVDHRFLLDASDDERGLKANRLKEAIADGCRATILTSACYADGWIVKDLKGNNQHPLSATPGKQSESWMLSPSASKRACGSIFASSVIETLASKGSPLVAAEEEEEEKGEEAGSRKEVERLQPDQPNDLQVETYNSFCQSILDICKGKLHRMADEQGFCFSAQDDQWNWSWTKRTGTPLAHFQSRWDALETVEFTGDKEERIRKLYRDPDPSNNWATDDELRAALARISGSGQRHAGLEVQKEMEDLVYQQRIPPLAKLLLETCPEDWSKGWGNGDRCYLEQLATGVVIPREKSTYSDTDPLEFIRYRLEAAAMADRIVSLFQLPVPFGESCIMCDLDRFNARAEKESEGYLRRYSRIWSCLAYDLFPMPRIIQGPPMARPLRYVVAAVSMMPLSDEKIESLTNEILEYTGRLRKSVEEGVATNEEVARQSRRWIASIGRKVRR
ncbi:hypothetical protein CaCOL14_009920 [Colletotrichum acutatum]|uniref:Uncharacterized protein n=1 Tax=Glomerella acutata TaxID=27357 RepID=A0AAD8UBE4_GLOAC|nr:uncharacterized protein BDZ83DRAFT_756600 [Colletotrichum acutatum]KAK1714096.1 hypothetical protein BDZ83DRAFT_756600 [Colletotrichum acutatum]